MRYGVGQIRLMLYFMYQYHFGLHMIKTDRLNKENIDTVCCRTFYGIFKPEISVAIHLGLPRATNTKLEQENKEHEDEI